MAVEEDLSLEAKAREWLDMAQTKWRLQTMQHRSRYNPKTGEYKQLPTRVRRFLNGTPVSMKARVLSILKESAPYSCPVFDLETGDAKYVPVNTFIRKDGPELTSGGADATYTIVQDLKLFDESGDIFGMRDESSCAQVGEAEWHWDEPDVADCPLGGQGVSYQIANVSRDRETDLFSYVVRKVQALTVHVQPVVVACTERSRVTVESWDNVYGEPGAFRWDPVRGGSAALDVPEACDRTAGTLVKVSVNRNADCTYRVEVERTEAVAGLGMYFVQHDRYRTEEGERTLNAFSPLPRQGIEYGNGLVTRLQSERNEDGTWTNDINSTLERPVASSTVETRVTPRGTVRMRTDTNMPDPASRISTDFGSWKSVKTPGGLYTNEYVEYVRNVADNLGLVCTDTAFLKTHETQGSAASVPSSGHVPPAADGLVTTWMYDTDAEGLVTRRVRTEQEHTVPNAVRRVSWGWLGNTSGFTHRSVSPSVAAGLLESGEAGTSVEARATNGGLFDVEVQTFLRVAGVALGADCQKTVYQHVHETAASASSMGAEAQDAGDGRTYRRSYALDAATGAITERETVTTELEVPESRRVVRVTPRGKTVRTVRSNSPVRPADASEPGQTTEFEVTPGGRYNVTSETVVPSESALETGCSKDAFGEADSSASTSEDPGPAHVSGGSGGVYRESTSRQGDDGLWENRSVVHTETPDVDDGEEVSVTARGTRVTVKRRNAAKPDRPTAVGRSVKSSRTRGGLYDTESTTVTPRQGVSGADCSRDVFEHADGSVAMSSSAPSGHVSGGTGGRYSERTSRQGDDGLWETRTVEHVETPNVEDGVEVVVTARGKRRTVKTRNSAKPAEPAAEDAGRALRTSRTRGGLYNVESTETVPNPSPVGDTCREDRFLKSEGAERTALQPESGHVRHAGVGGAYAERVQRRGDDGLWSIEETVHQEQTVTGGLEVSVTARGKRRTTVTRQTASQGTEPGVNDAGRALRRTVTRGGLYDLEETETVPREADSGKDCSKDLFSHAHSTGRTSASADAAEVPNTSDGSGTYRERRQRLGDDGLWSVDDTVHTELPVSGQRVEVRVSRQGKVKRTTDVQVDETGAEPQARVADIGRERIVEKTRGGKRNVTTVEVTPIRERTQESCSKDAFLHTHVTTKGVDSNTLAGGDVQEAANGVYVEKDYVLNDLGVWEERETRHKEITQDPKTVNYQDAFGTRTVQLFANGDDKFNSKAFNAETLIKSVEQEMTRGKKYSARVTEEKPTGVDSGWIKFQKTTDKGLAVYYDFIVFRNAKITKVKSWINHIKNISYTGGDGSYANHPSINISPNRFGLWDGSIALTTTFTPKSWASGGNTVNDNWETGAIEIKSVNFVPLSQSRLLKIVTTETHKRGGGVGRDKMEAVLSGGAMIKGSQFSYHPGGQAFSYDIITAVTTKAKVIPIPQDNEATIWDGSANP